MPITKDDFKRGLNDEVKKVLNFLLENKDNAFTSKEISVALGLGLDNIVEILRYLRGKKYAQVKEIGGSFYYIFERMP